MAETRLTNAVVPRVFTAYTAEESIYKARLFRSGVVEVNPAMSGLLNGGGRIFNLPFWQDVGGTSGDIPSETVAADVNNLAAKEEVFRRHSRVKAWGTNDLVKVFAGDNPLDALQQMVIDYWANALDIVTINSAAGVIADNIANDSGDIVRDISASAGAAGVFSSDAVIDAQALIGENGTVGRGDLNNGDFVAIAVHPSVYALMRKQNAIDFVAIGEQTRPTAFYMGMEVIVDRNMPVNGGVYDSYIFKRGAFQFGQSTFGYEPTEIDRNPSTGFGIDALYTRRVFGIHPVGTAWTDNTVTGGVSPSDANLLLAANWDRVKAKENLRMVMLRHKIA
ncbi:MAG: hypothetical protein C0436_00015 [Alphaproteobacteria bacterium]|nr:hypothetical protein [Alphaproteobacteria bacterium]